MATETAPQIGHPGVRAGTLFSPYQTEAGWQFDVTNLQTPYKEMDYSIKTWFRNGSQDWALEAFHILTYEDSKVRQAEVRFTYHSDNPPLERGRFRIGNLNSIRLREVLHPKIPPQNADPQYSNVSNLSNHQRSIFLKYVKCGPFGPWNEAVNLRKRFYAFGAYVTPFPLYPELNTGFPTSEDPNRIIVHTIIKDRMPEIKLDLQSAEIRLKDIRRLLRNIESMPTFF